MDTYLAPLLVNEVNGTTTCTITASTSTSTISTKESQEQRCKDSQGEEGVKIVSTTFNTDGFGDSHHDRKYDHSNNHTKINNKNTTDVASHCEEIGDRSSDAAPEADASDNPAVLAFLDSFTMESKSKEIGKILAKTPDSVGQHFDVLVPNAVTYEQFWQRYYFRCDPERIQRKWDEEEKNASQGMIEIGKKRMKTMFESALKVIQQDSGEEENDDSGWSSSSSEEEDDDSIECSSGDDDDYGDNYDDCEDVGISSSSTMSEDGSDTEKSISSPKMRKVALKAAGVSEGSNSDNVAKIEGTKDGVGDNYDDGEDVGFSSGSISEDDSDTEKSISSPKVKKVALNAAEVLEGSNSDDVANIEGTKDAVAFGSPVLVTEKSISSSPGIEQVRLELEKALQLKERCERNVKLAQHKPLKGSAPQGKMAAEDESAEEVEKLNRKFASSFLERAMAQKVADLKANSNEVLSGLEVNKDGKRHDKMLLTKKDESFNERREVLKNQAGALHLQMQQFFLKGVAPQCGEYDEHGSAEMKTPELDLLEKDYELASRENKDGAERSGEIAELKVYIVDEPEFGEGLEVRENIKNQVDTLQDDDDAKDSELLAEAWKTIKSLETKLDFRRELHEEIEKIYKDDICVLREENAKLKEECNQQEREKKVFQVANEMMIALLHTQFQSSSNEVLLLLQDDLARLKSLNEFEEAENELDAKLKTILRILEP